MSASVKAEIERPAFVKDEHLEFLDDLRESGDTNMFGAPPYLQAEFDMSRERAVATTSYWMKTFAARHPR